MSETEKLTVGALLSALALAVPGFMVHVAPRFPGSPAGGFFGIAGATLLILVLIYSLVKRNGWVRQHLSNYARLSAFLEFHIYAGVVGALFGIIHTGHKFQSPLGIGLVSAMLTVIFTGFIGRYYLAYTRTELTEDQQSLVMLRTRYDATVARPTGAPADPLQVSIARLVGGMAELGYAIDARETLKRMFSRWMVLHISAAIVMYSLLVLHIWNGIYYGLRWLE
jgi:ABC-type transport system involved in cytochrome c biogenesis permease subunit